MNFGFRGNDARISDIGQGEVVSCLANAHFIEKIVDRFGEVIFQKKETEIKQVIDPRITFIIKDILQEAARRGTAKKVSTLKRLDLAGKTGTTNEAESTWFTGFNDYLVTSVWVGFDQPKSLGSREFGSSTALPIWIDYIESNLKDLPRNRSIPPEGLVSIKVNKTSGLRSENGSSNSLFEYFLEEYVPE